MQGLQGVSQALICVSAYPEPAPGLSLEGNCGDAWLSVPIKLASNISLS